MALDPSTGSGLRRLGVQRATTVLRHGLTFWRRSIQARVVASTVLLSALVIGIVGVFLLQQTRDGLLEQREAAAVGEATRVTEEAQDSLDGVPATETDVALQLGELVDPIVELGLTRDFAVVLSGPAGDSRIADSAQYTPRLDKTSVPSALEEHFQGNATTAFTYTELRRETSDGDVVAEPAIAVGSQVRLPADSRTYTLYYLFPLSDEIATLQLVGRAMLTAAGLLLLLVAGLTWLVTRQVVTPVRMARRVAERLAAGQLQERLRVSGEDDLARLATSFNQMATNLQRQIRQLEELSRVQRRFVSDVSHELRTPLTTVRMAGELLHDARGEFDPTTARAAELLLSELDRFETLLVDLLEISRFDAGAAVLEIDDLDLVDVAHRIVDATSALAAQNGVMVRIEADGPCRAEADVRRVERIVRNLVTNAIDHAESGDIVIRVASDEHAAALAVRDHGVGLAIGEAAMVFNRFWRADPARARTSGGTGLGLSIAMEDTHLHGGWLQAWGRPGEGAQFRLTLPRRNGGVLRRSPLPLVPVDATEPVA
ncbi:MtrAB system histidine kinase MtrB [Nocardioides euryhalodurans]|uniref:Sensor histidine kinase MtrB n=1 Tax=Nocardioides euryhalodurans TaxID=2518370 RepID=A0A4P7GJP1_9ACTN|nr:MtrAB system histidine kinase MtrB [Nocardioides euryhalodurans]QBR91964.1 HAMP domain-containing histidine kinase [Nocardioides euryhalodurans]